MQGDFRRIANEVQAKEPFLYDTPQFRGTESRWTRENQRFIARNALDFNRIAQLRDSVSLQQLKQVFQKYGRKSSQLLPQIYVHFAVHREMNVNQPDEEKYVHAFSNALTGILPSTDDGDLPVYTQMACDYMSQPINALWYSANALRLIDLQGKYLFGETWECERNQLMAQYQILPLSEFRAQLGKGLPYTLPERFRNMSQPD